MPEHWKMVLLLMYLTDHETIRRTTEEISYGEACEEFERWAKGCPYLVFENYGNATEHICRHPDRDDPSTWVMCGMGQCPMLGGRATTSTTCRANAKDCMTERLHDLIFDMLLDEERGNTEENTFYEHVRLAKELGIEFG